MGEVPFFNLEEKMYLFLNSIRVDEIHCLRVSHGVYFIDVLHEPWCTAPVNIDLSIPFQCALKITDRFCTTVTCLHLRVCVFVCAQRQFVISCQSGLWPHHCMWEQSCVLSSEKLPGPLCRRIHAAVGVAKLEDGKSPNTSSTYW